MTPIRLIGPVNVLRNLLAGLTLSALLLTACSENPSSSRTRKSGKDNSPEESADTVKLVRAVVRSNESYRELLEYLDRSDLRNIPRALSLLTRSKADSLSRDSMLVSFYELMNQVMQDFYDARILGKQALKEQFMARQQDPEAAKLVSQLASNGIRLNFKSGEFYLEPDHQFVLRQLNKSLTACGRDYLLTKIYTSGSLRGESRNPVSVPDSLSHLLAAWESFMERHPDFIQKEEIQSEFLENLNAYLAGTEELPLFNPETKAMEKAYPESYQRYIRENPGRKSAGIVKQYYDLLAAKGFRYSEEIEDFQAKTNIFPTETPQ